VIHRPVSGIISVGRHLSTLPKADSVDVLSQQKRPLNKYFLKLYRAVVGDPQ